jgi:hypothetical protein
MRRIRGEAGWAKSARLLPREVLKRMGMKNKLGTIGVAR